MMSQELPTPNIANWQRLYQPNAQVRCIKDNPPMKGFGKPVRVGDVLDIQSVCWEDRYTVSVPSQCAFYDLEGYFEVVDTSIRVSTKSGGWAYTPTETRMDGKPSATNGELFVTGFETRESAAQHAYEAWWESERDNCIVEED